MRTPSPVFALTLSMLALGVTALINTAPTAVSDSHAETLTESMGGSLCPAVIVDYTFLAYDGPVGITGACLAHYQYTGGRMTVVAYDRAQDGLFHNSFEWAQLVEDAP